MAVNVALLEDEAEDAAQTTQLILSRIYISTGFLTPINLPRQIKESGSFVQKDGAVAFFLPGEIHNTLNLEDGRSVVVRLESQKLDLITRYQYNPTDNAVTVMER